MSKRNYNESTLAYYDMAGISNLTDKHYKIRLTKEYFYELYSILFVEKKHLRFTFHAYPTFKGDTSLPNSYDKKEKAYYTIQIQFLNVISYIKAPNILIGKITLKDMKTLKDHCEVQFYSNDKSFYWQGFWEDLSKNNSAIYSFKGTNGKGIWKDIHAKSGGLTDPSKRVTKHIEQLIKEFDDIMDRQLSGYLKRHTIKPVTQSKVFKEKYSNIEKLKLAQNEKDVRTYLQGIDLKPVGFLNDYFKKISGNDASILKEIKPRLMNLINDHYDENAEAIKWINDNQVHIEEFSNEEDLFKTYNLMDLWSDSVPDYVIDYLNQLYDIKFLNANTNSVGKGELLFASILDGFHFNNSKQSDLINGDNELIEIKSNMGKFSGSKRFDTSVNNINFNTLLRDTMIELIPALDYRENLINSGDIQIGDNGKYIADAFSNGEARPIQKEDASDLYNTFATWMNDEDVYHRKFAKTLYRKWGSNVLEKLFEGAESNDLLDLGQLTKVWYNYTKQFTKNATGDSLKNCFYRFLSAAGFAIYGLGEFKSDKTSNYLGYMILCNKENNNIKLCIINAKVPGELFNRLITFALQDPKKLEDKWGINFTTNLSKGSRGVSGLSFKYSKVEEIFNIINTSLEKEIEDYNNALNDKNPENPKYLKKFRNGKEWVSDYNDYLLKQDTNSIAIIKDDDLETADFELTLKHNGENINTLVFQVNIIENPNTLNIFYKEDSKKILLNGKSLKKPINEYLSDFMVDVEDLLNS